MGIDQSKSNILFASDRFDQAGSKNYSEVFRSQSNTSFSNNQSERWPSMVMSYGDDQPERRANMVTSYKNNQVKHKGNLLNRILTTVSRKLLSYAEKIEEYKTKSVHQKADIHSNGSSFDKRNIRDTLEKEASNWRNIRSKRDVRDGRHIIIQVKTRDLLHRADAVRNESSGTRVASGADDDTVHHLDIKEEDEEAMLDLSDEVNIAKAKENEGKAKERREYIMNQRRDSEKEKRKQVNPESAGRLTKSRIRHAGRKIHHRQYDQLTLPLGAVWLLPPWSGEERGEKPEKDFSRETAAGKKVVRRKDEIEKKAWKEEEKTENETTSSGETKEVDHSPDNMDMSQAVTRRSHDNTGKHISHTSSSIRSMTQQETADNASYNPRRVNNNYNIHPTEQREDQVLKVGNVSDNIFSASDGSLNRTVSTFWTLHPVNSSQTTDTSKAVDIGESIAVSA